MNSSICTLFEGHYHYGVATLSNSLYSYGFRGTIYVGYRGELPKWALEGKKGTIGKWQDAITLTPIEGIQLIFLELTTDYSLTNYKPDFMLELWQGPAKESEALYYFDPDIVVNDSWSCFEQWVHCGVAVCEDVNSPLQEFHPRRQSWKNYFSKYDFELKFVNQIYVNGGFIGLLKKDINFLTLWIKLQESMSDAIGGLKNSIFSNQAHKSTIAIMDGFQYFDKSDQDALNAAIEVFGHPISYIGKEGMGFVSGKIMMYHALGGKKPWLINYLVWAFNGTPPRDLDVVYFNHTCYPIVVQTGWKNKQKKLSIKVAKLIGRFYKV
jgi:hypothetical protein